MKKILLTLILALVANTVMADWSLVDESADDSVTIYTDFDTIQKTEDKVKIWSLGDTVLELRGKLASIKQVGRDDNGLLVEWHYPDTTIFNGTETSRRHRGLLSHQDYAEAIAMRSNMNPHKLEKWNHWLGNANSDGAIVHELSNLALIREIHSGLREMVDNNKNLQKYSAFYSVVQITYSQSALMYIRRQVRRDVDSVSLINLAQDISENCDMFMTAFYSGLYAQGKPDEEYEGWKRLGERDLSMHFGGRLGTH